VGLLVGDVVRRAAAATPARQAITFGASGLTFAELDAAGNRLAYALASRGLKRGVRVVWWSDPELDAAPLFVGLARAGAVFAPLNPRFSAEEARAIVDLAEPGLVIADAAHTEAAAGLHAAPVVALADLVGDGGAHDGTVDATDPMLDERDSHVVFFTSGSTGRPKGVVLSHRANCLRGIPGLGDLPAGGTVCMFPLFHMASWSIALGCWQARQAVHLVESPDPRSLLDAVERHRARRIYLIPAVWARVLDHGVTGHDLSSLREADTGTSATPPELLAAIGRALPHTETRVFYGSTEAGPAAVLGPADLVTKAGRVGQAAPGVELRIGSDGEVELRSEFLMDGYLDDPEQTAAALVDGWYRTGDAGVLDEDGYLTIVGRVRDVIRTGGETVSPAEVEGVVLAHPAVADVAVVGLPDPQWGEIVCAVVVTRDGHTVDVTALREHCAAALAPFKHPRRVELVDALPRTAATGQVQRALIVERILTTPAPSPSPSPTPFLER